MASGIKVPVGNVIRRTYVAQAATAAKQPNYTLPHHQPEVSKLPSGAVVASLENNSPISRIGVFVKSGSRYETTANSGVSHVLRLCAGLATKNFTAFGLTRKTQQLGGTLECEHGREHVSYEMSFLRDNIEEGFEMLSDVASSPLFKPWEVANVKTRLLTELGARSPSVIALDNLHSAAFRNTGLGNTLFVPNYRLGKHTPDQLHDFFNGTHTSSRVAFVGLGVDHKHLVKMAQRITFPTGDGLSGSGSYGGGEVREENGDSKAYVALAGPGAKIGSEEAAAFAVAQFILGGPAGTKYGSNASNKLVSWISSSGGSAKALPINASYTDGGLFGFLLISDSEKAGEAVKAVAKGIRSLKVTDSDVNIGKAKAKAALLMGGDCSEGLLEEMGLQALLTGSFSSLSTLTAAIDKVTTASVQTALSNSIKGKLSMSALGGISNVPYIDQL